MDPVTPVTHSLLPRSDLGGHGQSDVPRSDLGGHDQGNIPRSDFASTARCGEVRVGSHPSRGHPTPKCEGL